MIKSNLRSVSIEAKSKYMDKAKETRRKNTYVDLINGLLAWMLTHRRCSKKLIIQIGIYIMIIKALIKTCKDIFGQNCHMRRNVVKSFMDQGILSKKLE